MFQPVALCSRAALACRIHQHTIENNLGSTVAPSGTHLMSSPTGSIVVMAACCSLCEALPQYSEAPRPTCIESQRVTATGGPTPAILRHRPTLSRTQLIALPGEAKQRHNRLFGTVLSAAWCAPAAAKRLPVSPGSPLKGAGSCAVKRCSSSGEGRPSKLVGSNPFLNLPKR